MGSLIVLCLSLASSAQQGRWEQLNTRAQELYAQGKYSEAIPIAEEAVRVAEAAFGSDDPRMATSLNYLALFYSAQGRYAEAEPLFQRALRIREKALGAEHPDVALSLNNLAELYHDQGKYGEAELLLRRSLAITEKALGPEHPLVATSLNNLAELYRAQGKYAEAEPLYRRSLAIREKALGPEHPNVALALNNLAVLYQQQGKYADAEPLYRRALRIREKVLGSDHPDVAQSLNNLAELYRAQGKYAEAGPLYQRSLHIDEKALGPEHPAVGTDLNNLAMLYHQQGKYADAEPLYLRSLAIGEKALGSEHPDVAQSLSNLAELYRAQGKYAEAEPLLQRALNIREKVLGAEHPDMALSLNNLAELYLDQGKYAEAEPLYRRSLAINEKVLGPEHPNVGASLSNLASLYTEQGKYAEAEPLLRRSLAISEKALGPEHPDVARSLNNLAELYRVQGKYAEAEPLLHRSLAIQEKALGPEHADVATALGNLAPLYHHQGKYAEAEPLYLRSLAIREKALGDEHPDVALSLNNLAGLYGDQGKYDEAEPLLRRSLAIWEKALGPEHPNMATLLNNLALLYTDQGKYAEAEPLYRRSLQNLSHQFEYHFTYMSEKERLQFLDTVAGWFPGYFSFCLTYEDRDPSLTGKMYDVVLWEKGFVGQSIAALRAKIAASGDPEALKLLDQLTALKQQLSALLNKPGPDHAAWQKQLSDLQARADHVEQELVRRSAALQEDKKLERVTWRDVQKALKPGEAAVEMVKFRFYDGKKFTDTYKYVALIVTPETTTAPTLVLLGEAKDLEAEPLKDYQQLVQQQAAPDSGTTVTTSVSGARFYAAFWQPLEKPLGGAQRVYLSPDGVLNQISWAVLTSSDGKALAEQYDLRLLSSTKDLLRQPRGSGSQLAILVGNPKFEMEDAEQRAAVRGVAPAQPVLVASAANVGTNLRSRDPLRGALNPLPGTKVEVESVARFLQAGGWHADTYTESRALEEAVKQVRQPRLLHLATHGFFLPDQQVKRRAEMLGVEQAPTMDDPMLRSGLFLAGAERTVVENKPPADLEDGVLTAYEATQLNLQGTELVVLSACETGLGEAKTGEGVFGLRRALQIAGAQSVMMTMWSVPDRETQELMSLFYQKWLAGKDKHQALREAQREMREKVKARYGRDLPFYWGAFVLVGR